MAEIIIKGQRELERKLERLEPKNLTAALLWGGDLIKTEMQEYPPRLPNQRYVRKFI